MNVSAAQKADHTATEGRTTSAEIADALRDQISAGQLAPASPLPSERALSELYGVNRRTIQRAIAQLRVEGLVEAFQGRGVFVRRPGDWPTHTHSRTVTIDGDGNWVDSESASGGWKPVESPTKYHINATGELAKAFGVPEGTSFYASDRLLENAAGTRILVRNYLPMFVTKELRKLSRGPYISARQTYKAAREAGMNIELNDYIITRNPAPDTAKTLKIPAGVPMFITRRIATHDGKPILMQETHRSGEDTQLHYRPKI